jgi:PAS domain S-box-containing protein
VKNISDAADPLDQATLVALFDTLPIGVVVHGTDGRVVAANASALDILGLSLEEITGKTSMDPEWQAVREDGSPFPGPQHPAMLCLSTGTPVKEVVMGVTSQNLRERRWLRIHANPLLIGCRLTGAYACFEDITARRHTEAQLADAREQLELALAGANLGTYDAHLTSGLVAVNDRYLALLGYAPGQLEMSVAEWMNRIHPDDLPRIRAHHEQIIATTGKYVDIEYRLRHKAGHWVWLHDRGRVFQVDAENRPVRVAGTQLDISLRKQAETLLRQDREETERTLAFQIAQQTVAGIAHELNQPLNAMTTLAEAARRIAQGLQAQPPQLTESLEGIVRCAQRAGRTVHELIGFLRTPDLSHGAVELPRLLSEAADQCRISLPFAGEIKVDLPEDLPRAAGNAMRIEKIVGNLLRNAVEACQTVDNANRAGQVILSARVERRRVSVIVEDNGPGVDAELLSRLFQPFASTKPGGIGMGLPISQSLARSMGGELAHEAVPGGGARFRLSLPAFQATNGVLQE